MPLAAIHEVSGRRFDYVVIGGGTAGLALATRLSEDASVTVLVLEAGEANLDDPHITLPAQFPLVVKNPKYDWDFQTIDQVHSGNRPYNWTRGKGLGGSSGINSFLWNKPAREYIDAFEELGNPGWNWDTFHTYSKKSERFTEPDHDRDILMYDISHRGQDGPVAVSFPSVISNVEKPFIEALKKHGIEHLKDNASGTTRGVGSSVLNIDPATHGRSYSANMYFQPNSERANLVVLVSAHVAEIITVPGKGDNVKATGVKFLHGGATYNVTVGKEAILSAGAIMSPQILELSGIGDPSVLQKAGVPVKVDLAGVGANVQEHLYVGTSYEVKEHTIDGRPVNTLDRLLDPTAAAQELALLSSGQGLFNLGVVNLTFLPLDAVSPAAPALRAALAERINAGIAAGTYASGLAKQYALQLRLLDAQAPGLELALAPMLTATLPAPDPTKKHVSLVAALNTPFSRGTIHIRSRDPLAPPLIDPHVFEDPYDLASLVELIKFSRRLAHTEPLKRVLAETEAIPGPSVATDAQIAEWLRSAMSTTYHTVGSCAMLPRADGGVVGPRLTVYGTDNIRVVDVSIVPLHIGSHTQAPAYAIAEQAADIIKGKI